jgi:hypothetical protein
MLVKATIFIDYEVQDSLRALARQRLMPKRVSTAAAA